MTTTSAADLLFEIGTEELPAAYLPGLIEQLEREAIVLFDSQHLPHGAIQAFGTPRRLTVVVKNLADVQQTPGTEIRGPSKQAAFDASGKPTPALHGFLRSQGGKLEQTTLVSSSKGEYVYFLKPPATTPTKTVLPALLPQLIGKLRSPKTMRWDASGVRFARPVRWLVALYGSVPIRCAYGRLNSGTKTTIGRPQQLHTVSVKSVDAYFRTLKGGRVVLDHRARRQAIEQTVTKTAKTFRGAIAPEMISHGLLDEVTYLVEEPAPLTGDFDPAYLVLPREVLLASMAKHQRVFAIEAGGKLLPRCIAILEGKPKQPALVRKIVQRILNARLADSLLFWQNDAKVPLDRRDLSGVTFHEKLGSMTDKSKRITQLSAALADAWSLKAEERKRLERACLLAKADLVTTLVREFPTLQGTMGKHYALSAGEPAEVAHAIEEHYLPLLGRMPKTLLGSALSVLDKYDTLAGYFSVGITPSGDQDPFGLRRAAQGIVEVGWAVHRPLPLQALFTAWQKLSKTGQGKAGLAQQIQTYLLERLYTFAWPTPVPSNDCIDAVVSLYQSRPCDDLIDVMERIRTLQQLSGRPAILKAAKVIERTRNILKGAADGSGDVDPDLLKEDPERQLWDVYRGNRDRVVKLIEERSYDRATQEFADLFYEPLHLFFDKVMVNDPDAALKRNRLALMRAIHTLYTDRIADLSKLTVLQQREEHS